MAIVKIPNCGTAGVLKDLSVHELPEGAWTDSSNVRFLDGYCQQFLGHGQVYGAPANIPQHVMAQNIGDARYWIYATAANQYAVTITGGVAVTTDISHVTPRAGVPNQWTSTSLSGIPIFNTGDTATVPMYWNLNLANKFVDLPAWPAGTYCKALRTYKVFLVALNITRGGQNFGYMVKWSNPADPGSLPSTWDPSDPTADAGEGDLAQGGDAIIDGLQLRDSFMIYKEASVWRMDFVGGVEVMRFQKVLGISGAMNRNCIVELDGYHFVLTGSDVIVHDGQTSRQVLDKKARRALFQDMDTAYNNLSFVFKNPFVNEVFVCYTSIGATKPNKALVWNYNDNTVSYRTIPNLYHAAYGTVDNSLSQSWAADNDPWYSDLTAWNGPDFTPNTTRVLMASADNKLFLLDSAASYDGVPPVSYLERRGLGLNLDERIKLVTGIRLRITGNVGQTVVVKVGSQNDPYEDPVYTTMTHTIGETVQCDCFVSGRYIAIRIESGSAYFWRLDSVDIFVEDGGAW